MFTDNFTDSRNEETPEKTGKLNFHRSRLEKHGVEYACGPKPTLARLSLLCSTVSESVSGGVQKVEKSSSEFTQVVLEITNKIRQNQRNRIVNPSRIQLSPPILPTNKAACSFARPRGRPNRRFAYRAN